MAGAPVPTAPSRAERLAFATSTLFLFVAPFAASAGTRATCLIIAAFAILWGSTWRAALDRLPPRDVLIAIGAWILLAPLSLAWSIDWRYTLEELRAETLYGALAFGVCFVLAADPPRWRVWCITLLAGTVVTLAAKGLQLGFGIALWRHSPDGGIGAFSTHLVLIAPLLVALVWDSPWGFRRGALFLAAALVALLSAAWAVRDAWMIPNRIVWPSLAVVFLVAIVAGRASRAFEKSPLAGLRGVVLAAALAICIAFAASIAAKSERFYRADPGFGASVERDLRPRLWSVGIEQLRSAPWLGHGFGREILAPVFLPETPAVADHPPIRHSHNALINIAMELGIVGLAVFVAVLFTLARHYARLLARPEAALFGVIGLALLAGFITKNMTDDFLHRHNAQVFWALNGMLLGFSGRSRGS
jgi:O-antigen ligase